MQNRSVEIWPLQNYQFLLDIIYSIWYVCICILDVLSKMEILFYAINYWQHLS